jgi:hypothetical protein
MAKKIATSLSEGAPVRAELKFHRETRGHTNGDVKKKKTAPESGLTIIGLIGCSDPAYFQKNQEETQTDRGHRPENVEHGGKCELHSGKCNCIRKAIHIAIPLMITEKVLCHPPS